MVASHRTPEAGDPAAPPIQQERFSVQSDLCALMATAYTAVTGIAATRHNDRILPSWQHSPHVSAAFEAVLSRALHPDKRERYHHPAELVHALRPLLHSSAEGDGPSVAPGQVASAQPKAASVPEEHGRTSGAVPFQLRQRDQPYGGSQRKSPQRLTGPAAPPPLPPGHDALVSLCWLSVLLLGALLLVLLAR